LANRASAARKVVAGRDTATRQRVPREKPDDAEHDVLRHRLACPDCGNALTAATESLIEQAGSPQLCCQSCMTDFQLLTVVMQ